MIRNCGVSIVTHSDSGRGLKTRLPVPGTRIFRRVFQTALPVYSLGAERTALAADIWDQVLRSVAKTRQRNQNHRPPISNLEFYLIGVFHHRFNRFLKREQKRAETVEFVSSALDLVCFEAAVDSDWAEQLERAIAVRQITEGSTEGTYEIRIVTDSGGLLLTATGEATLVSGIASVPVDVNLGSKNLGRCNLEIRQNTGEWNSVPLVLR